MKVTRITTLRADAGWRIFSFLRIDTDVGITGWSEYHESFGSAGLSHVIEALTPIVIGHDPRRVEQVVATLHVMSRQSRGGLTQQAIAAIENALLDIKGKDLGVPVHALFGGAVRERIPLYWTHAGTYRTAYYASSIGIPQLSGYDDLQRLGEEIRSQGFKAAKTNILLPEGGKLVEFVPGFGRRPGWPELNWNAASVRAAVDTVAALRDGLGPDLGLMLDINFNFKTEGFRRVAEAVAPYDLAWLEVDTHDAASLRLIRDKAPCPVASCETLCHRRDFKPFFEVYAMDVGLIDVIWNGLVECLKIAAMAEVYEINVAPHNFYGHLSSVMCAHFSAMVPNLRIMETDIDGVPWRDELVSAVPVIENGEMVPPTAPGWGIDVNEAGVRAHPPRG